MAEKEVVRQNKDEFLERLNAEFGCPEEWEARKSEISAQTGADNVYIQKDVLATKLSQEGYIYKVHIGRCRFTARLRPEDVGLDPENEAHKDFVKRYLSLGRKLLLPTDILKRLDQLEGKIRRVVDEKYAVPTVAGSFVPFKNVEPMKEEIEKLKEEYFAVRDEILDRYDAITAETEASYRKFAVEVYRLIKKNAYYSPSDDETEQFVRSAMNHFPSKKEIYGSFYVTLNVGVIETTEFLSNQEVRLRLIREREEAIRQEMVLCNQIEKERAEIELARLQVERRAVEEAIAQKREEYLPRMEQVFADLAGAVHGIIYDAVDKANRAIKLNGSLSGAHTKSLKGLTEKVRNLIIKPDPEVEVWLKKINDIVETAPEHRDPEEVRKVIQTIRSEAARVILSIGRVPRTVRGDVSMAEIEEAANEEYIPLKPRQVRMFAEEEMKELQGGTQAPLVRVPRVFVKQEAV